MYKYRSVFLGCFIWSLLGCGGNSTSNPKGIQDSKSAVEYFQNKLNFTTNPNGVQGAISSHEKITIIDVRDEKSFAEGHIPGAINLPESKWKNASEKDIKSLGLRKDGFNYVYCYAHLCSLAARAAEKFASFGYPVKEMEGGFPAWKDKGYSIGK